MSSLLARTGRDGPHGEGTAAALRNGEKQFSRVGEGQPHEVLWLVRGLLRWREAGRLGGLRGSRSSLVSRVSLSASSSRGCGAVTSGPRDAGCGGVVFSPVFSFFYSRAPGVGEEKGWGEGHTQWCFSSPPQGGIDVRDERQRRSPVLPRLVFRVGDRRSG